MKSCRRFLYCFVQRSWRSPTIEKPYKPAKKQTFSARWSQQICGQPKATNGYLGILRDMFFLAGIEWQALTGAGAGWLQALAYTHIPSPCPNLVSYANICCVQSPNFVSCINNKHNQTTTNKKNL